MKIGEIIPADREITLNEGKNTVKILVANKGDRPVQVGSHYHFFEVNKCLSFDRETAYGYHLDIPSGTSVRFEPGEEKEVQLTQMGGGHLSPKHPFYGHIDRTSAIHFQQIMHLFFHFTSGFFLDQIFIKCQN